MHLPDFLEPYRIEGEALLDKVGHIEFSNNTYQVQIRDPNLSEDAWAFLQLGASGAFKDGFCSCSDTEDVSQCAHLASAYMRLFNHSALPLYERFNSSLWNVLCERFAHEYGYEADILTKHKNRFGVDGKFWIEADSKETKERLHEILTHSRDETEETSIKFSNLSEEEIALWREGRPSKELCYELSFWNDIAKWLMLTQEEGAAYHLSFHERDGKLPDSLTFECSGLKLWFHLEEQDLAALISSLKNVNSPLVVHDFEEETIKSISYDEKEGVLRLQFCHQQFDPRSGIEIDRWTYVSGEGFFAKQSEGLLAQREISGEALGQALDQYTDLIEEKLEGAKLYQEPKDLQYTLRFDADWNLSVEGYLFKPGDLSEAPRFGNWVYLDGFYSIDRFRFGSIKLLVSARDVGEFVTSHRTWFGNYPGFETHLATLEGQLIYSVEKGALSFSGDLKDGASVGESHDFGSWIWIEGQGFYTKVGSLPGITLKPGLSLDREEVAPFIRSNREELKYVPGFFAEECPVKSVGLIVTLTDDERVRVSPRYELADDYDGKKVQFFEDFSYVDGEGFYQLPADKQLPIPFQELTTIDEDQVPTFVSQEIPRLERRYDMTVDSRLVVPFSLQLALKAVVELDQGFYELKLSYITDLGSITVPVIWRAMHEKSRFLFHEAGLLDLHHKRFNWIRGLSKKAVDLKKQTVVLSAMDVIKLNIFDPMQVAEGSSDAMKEVERFIEEMTSFKVPAEPNLKKLKSELRPYQKIGLDWLWFLYNHNLSGLLCDDMGLGKTHQAMALMESISHAKQREHNPFIIVCPTSVIYHWEDKLNEHLPHFKVCTFHGSKRSLKGKYDILLTSYGIWRIESKVLQQLPFELAILDEVQMAKNASSRLHASLLRMDVKMRLGLTGTPIENYLHELKSLFDVVLPNYMPGPTEFKDFFIIPIEKERDEAKKKLLNRFINPFLLRRKKEEVLTDLPEKTEEVYHCALLPEQQQLYNEVLERSRSQIMQQLRGDSSIPYMHIFAILSSLKQICDHPAVYLKCPEAFREHRSGKWDLFVELLHEARDSNQKVVIYSQYLAMLDIIESYLTECGIGYASIRGATTNRGEQLKRFNQDPNCEVFVGSLQASGLGVDLTAASVVIHYDRWWNAARENQATDRVHRIGQQRGVQVFKLVTKGTFEDRIDELITAKGKLMEDVVGSDDQNVVKYLDREEIIRLLKQAVE